MTVTDLLDANTIAGAIAFFIPLVVAFITKKEASDAVKAAAAFVGSVVAAVAALWLAPDHAPITWQLIVSTLLTAIVTQIGSYKAIWQHIGAPQLAAATANFGIGKVVSGEATVLDEQRVPFDAADDWHPDGYVPGPDDPGAIDPQGHAGEVR